MLKTHQLTKKQTGKINELCIENSGFCIVVFR